jgi:hypothetical protein
MVFGGNTKFLQQGFSILHAKRNGKPKTKQKKGFKLFLQAHGIHIGQQFEGLYQQPTKSLNAYGSSASVAFTFPFSSASKAILITSKTDCKLPVFLSDLLIRKCVFTLCGTYRLRYKSAFASIRPARCTSTSAQVFDLQLQLD